MQLPDPLVLSWNYPAICGRVDVSFGGDGLRQMWLWLCIWPPAGNDDLLLLPVWLQTMPALNLSEHRWRLRHGTMCKNVGCG